MEFKTIITNLFKYIKEFKKFPNKGVNKLKNKTKFIETQEDTKYLKNKEDNLGHENRTH